MYNVDEQELLRRADEVGKCGDLYRDYVYALEIFRSKYDRYLAEAKMIIRKSLKLEKVSEAELERHALESSFWGEKVEKGEKYLTAASRYRIDFEVAKIKYEAMRSALSSKRTEMEKLA